VPFVSFVVNSKSVFFEWEGSNQSNGIIFGAQVTSSALGTRGNAGFVRINAKERLVRDRGLITVQAANSQNTGDLEIKAANVTLGDRNGDGHVKPGYNCTYQVR
jgi:hypothetical protein